MPNIEHVTIIQQGPAAILTGAKLAGARITPVWLTYWPLSEVEHSALSEEPMESTNGNFRPECVGVFSYTRRRFREG
jgi:hypothetical protein